MTSAAAALLRAQPSEEDRLRAELDRQRHRFQVLLVDFENAQTDLTAKRREIAGLKAKIKTLEAPDELNAKLEQQAAAVFDYWNWRCKNGRAREFTDERRKAVFARLAARPVADLFTAVDGAYAHPYVDKTGKKFNELELICRNGSKFDSFFERGERYADEQAERDEELAQKIDAFNQAHGFSPENNIFGSPPGVRPIECWGCGRCFDGNRRFHGDPLRLPYCDNDCRAAYEARQQPRETSALRLVEAAA